MLLIDPDYARIHTKLRIKAWQYGWAVMVHGSMTRDLDLIMVPWEDRARFQTAEQCLILLARSENLVLNNRETPRFIGTAPNLTTNINWTPRPHGRVSISLLFAAHYDPRWVDVSVFPPPPLRSDPVSGD